MIRQIGALSLAVLTLTLGCATPEAPAPTAS